MSLKRESTTALFFLFMKYYYEKPDVWVGAGELYICDHPMYNRCTLFRKGSIGFAVIQEHYNNKTKARWWGSVDPWLAGDIYLNENFRTVFDEIALEPDENGLYFTITIRKLMWKLRMKPLRKNFWEEPL